MSAMKKRILIGGGVLALIVAFFAISRGNGIDVTVAAASRDTLSVTIAAEGRTRASERFTVAAPISGRVTRLDVREGQMVNEGDLLARLYPAPDDPRVVATARAEVDAAEARYREAEARVGEAGLQARQAEREVERRRPLAEMGAITRERMEQAELAGEVANQRLQSAEAGQSSARASLQAARARVLGAETSDDDVSTVDVRAPVAGRVVSVPDESERVVAAGSPLLELAGTGGLEIVLDVLSEDAVRVEPGHEVLITGWGGDGTLRGSVRTVTRVGYTVISALGVEEQRVDVVADLHHTPPALGTGYRVSGAIVVWQGTDVITVPTSALFRVGDAWQVFVVEDGRARRQDVLIGGRNEHAAEVTEGLAEGQRVILFPPEEVEDGTAVSVDENQTSEVDS
jgi:HlyD family secretion protein